MSIALEVQLPRSGESVALASIHEIHKFIGDEVIPMFEPFLT
jgi:hypothetical protein